MNGLKSLAVRKHTRDWMVVESLHTFQIVLLQ